MVKLYFGPAGVPNCAPKKDTITGIKTVKELGLDAMELEFVQGVRMSEEKAFEVKEISKKLGIILTVHAPYFINLNTNDREKYKNSIKNIYLSAKIGYLAGAKSVCFHPAYYQNQDANLVYEKVKGALMEIMEMLNKENIKIDIRPETMGKPTQFGTLEEVVRLSQEIPGVKPLVDFAHLHARGLGRFNTYDEFYGVLNYLRENLGEDILKDLHIHVSGIDYNLKGEKKHLNLRESDFNFYELLQVLRDINAFGVVICESPNLEEDAVLLKNTFNSL